MGGEAEFGAFSQGTATVLALTVLLSVGAGIFSRRILFPWLMDLFSKTERIDGRDLFAPKSLAWMVGLLVMWQSLDWLFMNESDLVWDTDLMTRVMDYSSAGFIILMLFAAYRLVDYLDAFIVVEGDDMAARRSLASVAESIGRLAVVIIGFFVIDGLF